MKIIIEDQGTYDAPEGWNNDRTIVWHGHTYIHVSTAPDGTWVYRFLHV